MKKKILRVYVAGPYRNNVVAEIVNNINEAKRATEEIIRLNKKYENVMIVPLCPHTLYGLMDGVIDGQWFVDATMEWCQACDATFVIGKWSASTGTLGEIADTKERGCPVFYTFLGLEMWISKNNILE